MILGSIEAGGTKFVCAVGNENYEVIDKAIFPTIDPATTIGNCIAFFKKISGNAGDERCQLWTDRYRQAFG